MKKFNILKVDKTWRIFSNDEVYAASYSEFHNRFKSFAYALASRELRS